MSVAEEAQEYGIRFMKQPLTRENFRHVLEPLVGRGDFVLNVSVDVSSIALVKWCWEHGALYLDTCIEPWPGGYTDPTLSPSHRSNYALREEALALRKIKDKDPKPTAVLTHGANPGLVSHFVKQALINLAVDFKIDAGNPTTREDWAALARSVGVKVIHIAERDTQVPTVPKRAGRIREHLVGGRLRQRRLRSRPSSAGARTSATSRATASASTSAAARDLPDAARRRHARAQLGAAGRPLPRLPDHARRGDLDRRLPTPSRTAASCSTGRRCTTPITRATRRCCPCTSSPAATGTCRSASAS